MSPFANIASDRPKVHDERDTASRLQIIPSMTGRQLNDTIWLGRATPNTSASRLTRGRAPWLAGLGVLRELPLALIEHPIVAPRDERPGKHPDRPQDNVGWCQSGDQPSSNS